MWRYVGVSIIVGLLVSTCVFVLYEIGFFLRPAAALWKFYESSGIFPDGAGRGQVDLVQFVVFTGLALGVAWCVIDIPRTSLNATVAAGSLILVVGLSFTLALYGIYFEPFSGSLAIVSSFVLGAGYSRTRQGRRKRLLLAVLGSRISQDFLLKQLGSNGDLAESKKRAVSVLTCRIFNHPQLMEELEPEELVELTNLFLKDTVEHLMAKGGYVDESRPEGVRVFFGVNPTANHAVQACKAALELHKRLGNLNAECERRWFQSLRYGIGVSSGTVTTGIFGSQREAFFSGVGTQIGFSRRLSTLNRHYGSSILIGAGCYFEAKKQLEVRPMEMVFIEEEDVMTEVYELLEEKGRLGDEHRKSRDAFWEGVIYYREGKYDLALEQFNAAGITGHEDAPRDYYIAKVEEELVHSGGEAGGKREGRSGSRANGMIRL